MKKKGKKRGKIIFIIAAVIILAIGIYGGITYSQLTKVASAIGDIDHYQEVFNELEGGDCTNFGFFETETPKIVGSLSSACNNPAAKAILAKKAADYGKDIDSICNSLAGANIEEEIQAIQDDCANQ
ncbi:MAG: hypothetical protein PHH00_01585 [Candidatus Nanoarchaeia archaeon]|nr:hypothetical protein [Candidatus Nanoarchaeia archaeon]